MVIKRSQKIRLLKKLLIIIYGNGTRKGQTSVTQQIKEITYTRTGINNFDKTGIHWGAWSHSQEFESVASPNTKGSHYTIKSLDSIPVVTTSISEDGEIN